MRQVAAAAASRLYSRAFLRTGSSFSSPFSSKIRIPRPPRRWILLASGSTAGCCLVCLAAEASRGGRTSSTLHHQLQCFRPFHSSKTLLEASGPPGGSNEGKPRPQPQQQQQSSSAGGTKKPHYGITEKWKQEDASRPAQEKSVVETMWEKISPDRTPSEVFHEFLKEASGEDKKQPKEAASTKSSSSSSSSDESSGGDPLVNIGSSLIKLIMGGGVGKEEKAATAEEIIKRARENAAAQAMEDDQDTISNSEQDGTTLLSVMKLLDMYRDKIDQVADRYMSTVDIANITPTALYYYVEYEDEKKNPSWKRRVHRYCSGIDTNRMEDISDACDLALIAYADQADGIQEALDSFRSPYALVYAQVNSQPGKPAHFIAVNKHEQSPSSPFSSASNELEVIMCVRGTKTFADAVTDIVCDVEPYRGGTAHSFILQSGQYLAKKHAPLLKELLQSSNKSKIKLTLIGHSLGAGAATIAGMELSDNEKIDVQVLGFGCPALLSKGLAEEASFVTTIINDSDMIPRMSGISAANLLTRILEFDWLPYAKKDIRHAVEELHRNQPAIFSNELCDTILGMVEPLLDNNLQDTIKKEKTEPLEPELFPPGKCVHFYRDGIGISVNLVPNTFFGELDFNRRMLDDHVFHSGYRQTLLEFMRQQKKDHHFRFGDQGERKILIDGKVEYF